MQIPLDPMVAMFQDQGHWVMAKVKYVNLTFYTFLTSIYLYFTKGCSNYQAQFKIQVTWKHNQFSVHVKCFYDLCVTWMVLLRTERHSSFVYYYFKTLAQIMFFVLLNVKFSL